jgi:hypothetical protein
LTFSAKRFVFKLLAHRYCQGELLISAIENSTAPGNPGASSMSVPLKLAAGALVLCVLGLPINDITGYICLAAASLVFSSATLIRRAVEW